MKRNNVEPTIVLIILGGNMYMQIKPCFIREESQMRGNPTAINWLQKPVAEINPAGQFTWLQSMNFNALYCRSLSSFDALVADDFEIPVSCARSLNDLYGVWSNLVPISSSLSSISTQNSFLAGFLSRIDPVDLALLISAWMYVVLGTVIPGNYDGSFSCTF
jgi:hypothetical protein